MTGISNVGEVFAVGLESAFAAIIALLPQLALALVILLFGWMIARVLRALAVRLARGLEHFSGSMGIHRAFGSAHGWQTAAPIIGSIVYWLVILVFLTIASNQLGLTVFTNWLNQVIEYLPALISGLVIIFAGFVISRIIRDAVIALAQSFPDKQRAALGRAAQVLVLAVLVIVGVDQVGVDVTLISILMAVVTGTFLAGLSIAFGLGARTQVSNILGIRYLGTSVQVGHHIRVDDVVGTVVEIGQTSIVLDTDAGQTRIPGKFLSEKPVMTYSGARDGG